MGLCRGNRAVRNGYVDLIQSLYDIASGIEARYLCFKRRLRVETTTVVGCKAQCLRKLGPRSNPKCRIDNIKYEPFAVSQFDGETVPAFRIFRCRMANNPDSGAC